MNRVSITALLLIASFQNAHADEFESSWMVDGRLDIVLVVDIVNASAEITDQVQRFVRKMPDHFEIDRHNILMITLANGVWIDEGVRNFTTTGMIGDRALLDEFVREVDGIWDHLARKYSTRVIIVLTTGLVEIQNKSDIEIRSNANRTLWFIYTGPLDADRLNMLTLRAKSASRVHDFRNLTKFQEEFSAFAASARCRPEETCRFRENGGNCAAFAWYPRNYGIAACPLRHVPNWCLDTDCHDACDKVWPWADGEPECKNGTRTFVRQGRPRLDEPEIEFWLFKTCPDVIEDKCSHAAAIQPEEMTEEPDEGEITALEAAAFAILGLVLLTLAILIVLGVVHVRKRRAEKKSREPKPKKHLALSPAPSPGGLGSAEEAAEARLAITANDAPMSEKSVIEASVTETTAKSEVTIPKQV